jgi:hypothetical protein
MNTTPSGLANFPLLSGDVVLPLPFAERYHRHLFPLCELLQRRHEALADRVHQNAGGELVTTVNSKETGHTPRTL